MAGRISLLALRFKRLSYGKGKCKRTLRFLSARSGDRATCPAARAPYRVRCHRQIAAFVPNPAGCLQRFAELFESVEAFLDDVEACGVAEPDCVIVAKGDS